MLKDNIEYPCFEEIPSSDEWVVIKEITAGWSNDKKYYIANENGQEYLLRITEIDTFAKKIKQFEQLSKIKNKIIDYPKPVAFGILSNNKVYFLLTWVKGEDASNLIPALPIEKQYKLGYKAGEFLKKMHREETKKPSDEWYLKYISKIERKIKNINDCQVELKNKNFINDYILKNMHLLKNRPITLNHGDFHIGNMVLDNDILGIIDFDKLGLSDPYDDFKPFVWNVHVSEYFASGIIDGYFSNKVPDDFFPILALYAAESLISQLPWAVKFGEDEIKTALKVVDDVLKWYDNFKLIIPTWYKKVMKK